MLLEQQYPDTHRQRGVQMATYRNFVLGDTARLIATLFGAVILFLVVACTNVASLQLARATSRRRELAVRIALGARRWHILRELMTESIVLSLVAGIIGAMIAAWSLGGAVALLPDGALPRFVQPSIDLRALIFALAASFAVGVLVTILPGISASRRELADALKQGARSAGGGLGSIRRISSQQVLVVAEIALAMTLLTAAALMVRSLERQTKIAVGFEPAGVTIGALNLPASRYTPEARVTFVERLRERLARIPGVQRRLDQLRPAIWRVVGRDSASGRRWRYGSWHSLLPAFRDPDVFRNAGNSYRARTRLHAAGSTGRTAGRGHQQEFCASYRPGH